MDKKKVAFSCKVKGDFSPAGLQKVYVSYAADDKEYIPVIAADIWQVVDCAVYYHEGCAIDQTIDLDDLEEKIVQMDLLVVIVTANYLNTLDQTKEREFGFALDSHIPVLPIAMESGLEAQFSSVMNAIRPGYGQIQLLKYHAADPSELSYQQKLARDIRSILVDRAYIARIKGAFTSKIFLSYRKKDRTYANQLMRTIHSIPSLQRVAIWYDEYISTGEAWNDQIQEALLDSDIFLLMVTPSIAEPDNYVIREEYPAARSRKMPIVPAQKDRPHFTPAIEQQLRQLFPELQAFVDGDDATALEHALFAVTDLRCATPERDHLIGLAFLNGIYVEKDTERAIALILASAEKGLPEAMNTLANMYWNGDGTEQNYARSIEYRKRLVRSYESKCAEGSCGRDDLLRYIGALERLTEDLYELSLYREAYFYGTKQLEAVSLLDQSDLAAETGRLYASAWDLLGKISMRLGMVDQARTCYQQYCDSYQKIYEAEPTDLACHDLSVGYERLGNVEYECANVQAASLWYQKALLIREELDQRLQTADSAQSLSCICFMIGDVYLREDQILAADRIFEKAFRLRERIYTADPTASASIGYGEAMISSSTTALLLGDHARAERLLKDSARIFYDLAEASGTIESWRRYTIVLDRMGSLELQQGRANDALVHYQESLSIRKTLLKKYRSSEGAFDCAITLYDMSQCYTRLLKKPEQMRALEEAIDYLLPILAADKKTDWHRIFAEAAFERFKADPYSGRSYLRYSIQGWAWLSQRKPEEPSYKEKCARCKAIYLRCYPE